jgi:hypothetical protein
LEESRLGVAVFDAASVQPDISQLLSLRQLRLLLLRRQRSYRKLFAADTEWPERSFVRIWLRGLHRQP